MNYFYIYLTVVVALLTSRFVHAFIFTVSKANKYEDILANKIAKQIVYTLDDKKLIKRYELTMEKNK